MAEVLTDIKIDLRTGFAVIVEKPPGSGFFDAELISGNDVILQDTAIRLNTQIGTVKQQLLDAFGWDRISQIKADVDVSNLQTVSKKLVEIVLEDDRILDAEVTPDFITKEEILVFRINLEIERGVFLSLPFNLET